MTIGNRIASSVLIGFIVSMTFAFFTKNVKYKYLESHEEEVIYEPAEGLAKDVKLIRTKVIDYNYFFITISFIGGTALGYLISDKLKK